MRSKTLFLLLLVLALTLCACGSKEAPAAPVTADAPAKNTEAPQEKSDVLELNFGFRLEDFNVSGFSILQDDFFDQLIAKYNLEPQMYSETQGKSKKEFPDGSLSSMSNTEDEVKRIILWPKETIDDNSTNVIFTWKPQDLRITDNFEYGSESPNRSLIEYNPPLYSNAPFESFLSVLDLSGHPELVGGEEEIELPFRSNLGEGTFHFSPKIEDGEDLYRFKFADNITLNVLVEHATGHVMSVSINRKLENEANVQPEATTNDALNAETMYPYMVERMMDGDYEALEALINTYAAENNMEMLQELYNNLAFHSNLMMIQATKIGDFDRIYSLLDKANAILNPQEATEPTEPVDVHSRETAEAFLKILQDNMEDVMQILHASDEVMALIMNPTVEDIMQGKLDSYFAVEDSVLYQSLYFMT